VRLTGIGFKLPACPDLTPYALILKQLQCLLSQVGKLDSPHFIKDVAGKT
jgi:hypothetical protein